MKKGKIIGIMVIITCIMTGCVDNMPDMTQEQTDLIAEYAADLLLKYSPNYNYKIADEEAVEEALAQESTEESTEENTEEISSQSEDEKTTETSNEEMSEITQEDSSSAEDTEHESVKPEEADIAGLLAMDEFEISYTSFEVADSYPKNGSGFAIKAPQGKKLLIIHFDVKNASSESKTCDIFEKEALIRVNVNEEGYRETMSTLLVNDFSTYMEELAEDETKDVVAVIAINEASEEEISSMTLQITCGDEKLDITIE